MLRMSRESRRITDTLLNMANKYDVHGEITHAHIYMCDAITTKFFSNIIISLLKPQINRIKKKEWKHFTIDYWTPYIKNVTNKTPTAKRDGYDHISLDIPSDDVLLNLAVISQYLLTDYSIDDASMIHKLCTLKHSDIIYACNIGKTNNVYEIRYINAVIDKEYAKKHMEEQKNDAINTKIKSSDKFMENDLHIHTIMDMAMMQHIWEEKKKNAELEKRFNDIFEDWR